MAKKKLEDLNVDEFDNVIMKAVNKALGSEVFVSLEDDDDAEISGWISTGSQMLDYIISNKPAGGWPQGRVAMLYGDYSSGKTHLALEAAKQCQKAGGKIVYIDTEQTITKERAIEIGVVPDASFKISHETCTENVFDSIEKFLLTLRDSGKRFPVLIVIDSLMQLSPKTELENDYESNTMALQARVLGKCFRKIVPILAQTSATLLVLNQIRTTMNAGPYQNPNTIPGGKALQFACSVMVELSGGTIKTSDGEIIGRNIYAKTTKNKTAVPNRKTNFKLLFGSGIDETEAIFDAIKEHGPVVTDGRTFKVSGDSAWKTFEIIDKNGKIEKEKKFQKSKFAELYESQEFGPDFRMLVESAMLKKFDEQDKRLKEEAKSDGSD